MKIAAPAKINLALDVLYRRPDGYHEVDMVMQTIGLMDEITLTESPGLSLTCNHPQVPADERNLAWRAAQLLADTVGRKPDVRIEIAKRIPIAAGLAGGSTDAAAVLTGLNRLWGLGLTTGELMEIGVRIGADVPFCIMKGTMRARGIGERLTPLAFNADPVILLVTPDFPVATARIYQQLNAAALSEHPAIDRVIARMEAGAVSQLPEVWGNVLQPVAFREYPALAGVAELFARRGLPYLMSGSGPTVFTLNPPAETAGSLLRELPPGWFGCSTGCYR